MFDQTTVETEHNYIEVIVDEIVTHEYANFIPDMDPEDYDALVQDIKKNGLLVPIVLHESKPRQCYEACKQLGIKPQYVT